MTKSSASFVPSAGSAGRANLAIRARHLWPLVAMALAACGPPAPLAKPSPATVYCQKQGGEIRVEGSVGMCHLPDGRVIEQWEYLRANIP